MSFGSRPGGSYSHSGFDDRPARNLPVSANISTDPGYLEKHERLQQRLNEVLEDNVRLAALLDDARLQIKELRSENVNMRGRLFFSADRSASRHADRLPLPSMHTPVTAEIAANPLTQGQNIAGYRRPDSANYTPACKVTHGPQSAPIVADGQRPWIDDLPYSRSSRGEDYFQSLGRFSVPNRLPGPSSIARFEEATSSAGSRCACSHVGSSQQHNQAACCNSDGISPRDETRETLPSMFRPVDETQQTQTPPDDYAKNASASLEAAPRVPGKRRKRHHDIASKIRSVQPVPRDIHGNYEMPVQVGILVVLNLGRVVWDRDTFHNERYIWPVGYTVQREYYSMVDPHTDVIYTCWVSEGKDAPLFHVEAEDMPDASIVAPTATGAWTAVLRKVNQIRHREHSNSASGPDYFGFSHPTIAKMVQDLPGADRCRTYVMQNFVEMKDRHVRGVVKKGRGGRPSIDMLNRGQRALMAASASSPSSAHTAQPEEAGLVRRISVATLTNTISASETSPS